MAIAGILQRVTIPFAGWILILDTVFFRKEEGSHRRLDSVLTTRFKISLSDKSASQAIPFYLQETVGGSDIDNEATLRASKDYRFRGPNSFLVQEEFDRRIKGPAEILCFYDAGNCHLYPQRYKLKRHASGIWRRTRFRHG